MSYEGRGHGDREGRGGRGGGGAEWFARPDPRTGEAGLAFSCTMCGRCCTGPEGFVLVDDREIDALAARMGVSREAFIEKFTRMTIKGRSLAERETEFGMDCIYLDRTTIPGKAVCGVYEDRPKQCRTWPFWPSNLTSRSAWERAKRVCPGMDKGTRYTVQQIRIQRDQVDI